VNTNIENVSEAPISTAAKNRKLLFWFVVVLVAAYILWLVREITLLLLISYGLAVLLDPLVDRLEGRGFSRTTATIFIVTAFSALILNLLLLCIPYVVNEFFQLMQILPSYVENFVNKSGGWISTYTGLKVPDSSRELMLEGQKLVLSMDSEQRKAALAAIGATLLGGYSLTLTIFNIALLPFTVFYFTRDLHQINSIILSFVAPEKRQRVREVAMEMQSYVYAFFRGQVTVAFILAILYVIGLALVGLPSAGIVGTLAGLLNVVPYLGVGIGIVLSVLITLMNEPTFAQIGMVVGVFVVVQALEGTIITPKIVGESVGLHPLTVIVALIAGGKLLGLLGMIIAIPAAAALRVLFKHLREAVEAPVTEISQIV